MGLIMMINSLIIIVLVINKKEKMKLKKITLDKILYRCHYSFIQKIHDNLSTDFECF